MALGAFGSVRARAAERLDEAGRLPVTFTVAERARHAMGVNLAYETNYGPSIRVYWEHRNLFGRAERLRLEAEVARIGTNGGLEQSTYRIGGTYRDPSVFGLNIGPDWSFVGSLFGLRERLEAYDRDAITFSALMERRFSERLSGNLGPVLDFGSIGPPGGTLTPYQILGFQFGGRYDGTDSLLDPAQRLPGRAAPSRPPGPSAISAAFAPLRVTGSTYWDVLGDRRSILAVRGTFGSLLGATRPMSRGTSASMPAAAARSAATTTSRSARATSSTARMAAPAWWRPAWSGGSGSGAISARWPSSMPARSAPVRHRIPRTCGSGRAPGLRYYTPIGPVRVDVAVPLVKQRD